MAFSVEFLRSTGQYTGDAPFMRGTVIEEVANDYDWRLLEVDWGPCKSRVNDKNLVLKSRIPFER